MSEQQNKGECKCEEDRHEVPEGHKYCQKCGKEYGVDYFEGDNCQKDTSPLTMEEGEKDGFITGKLLFLKNTNLPIYKANINGEISKVILANDLPSVISSAVSQALKEQRDTTLKLIDKYYLQYCREQNGLDHCKNCGLNIEELEKLLSNNKE